MDTTKQDLYNFWMELNRIRSEKIPKCYRQGSVPNALYKALRDFKRDFNDRNDFFCPFMSMMRIIDQGAHEEDGLTGTIKGIFYRAKSFKDIDRILDWYKYVHSLIPVPPEGDEKSCWFFYESKIKTDEVRLVIKQKLRIELIKDDLM